MITNLLTNNNNWWGKINPPPGMNENHWAADPFGEKGLVAFLNAILKIIFVVAGLFAFFQLVIAGFQFISAGGNPKTINSAWTKIWQSLLGLIIMVGSFVLAAIFGWLIFGDPRAILQPSIIIPK